MDDFTGNNIFNLTNVASSYDQDTPTNIPKQSQTVKPPRQPSPAKKDFHSSRPGFVSNPIDEI